jgi:hypothetical protein
MIDSGPLVRLIDSDPLAQLAVIIVTKVITKAQYITIVAAVLVRLPCEIVKDDLTELSHPQPLH